MGLEPASPSSPHDAALLRRKRAAPVGRVAMDEFSNEPASPSSPHDAALLRRKRAAAPSSPRDAALLRRKARTADEPPFEPIRPDEPPFDDDRDAPSSPFDAALLARRRGEPSPRRDSGPSSPFDAALMARRRGARAPDLRRLSLERSASAEDDGAPRARAAAALDVAEAAAPPGAGAIALSATETLLHLPAAPGGARRESATATLLAIPPASIPTLGAPLPAPLDEAAVRAILRAPDVAARPPALGGDAKIAAMVDAVDADLLAEAAEACDARGPRTKTRRSSVPFGSLASLLPRSRGSFFLLFMS
jgi:hypothetical protein